MILRSWVSLVTVAAIATASSIVPATTQVAEGASAPKLSIVTRTTSVQTHCGLYTFSIKIPALSGSTKANRTAVASWADFVRKDVATLVTEHSGDDYYGCKMFLPKDFTFSVVGSIYKGRYLSVMVKWANSPAGRLKTLNLDLKTGKTVPVSTFVSDVGKVYTWARCEAFVALDEGLEQELKDAYCPGGAYPQGIDGWRVSSSGLQVYAAWEDGEYLAPAIAWSKLVSGSYKKSKRVTTKNVPSVLTDDCGDRKTKGTVTVQGSLVTVSDNRSAAKYYGVKTAGTRVGGRWRVQVSNPAWGPFDWEVQGYVFFASKGGKKASQFVFYEYCTA